LLGKKINDKSSLSINNSLRSVYESSKSNIQLPKYEIPQQSMRADIAYNLIKDELFLDGNSRLNLATFVQTYMEPEASQLMADCFDKNMIDKDEYPQTAEIELRCVNIIAKLWNAHDNEEAVGTSTIGSSEASMLGGMALKWQWRKKMEAQGKSTSKPNMVMGANVQICWKKFVKYWDIEPRYVPCEGDRFILDPEIAVQLVDENTIGVVAIMGSTYNGSYEPVERLCQALDDYQEKTGIDVPVHVDGASGGFVAPFLQPDIVWDFRLPRVQSINASGHKYGLVYPGVGWVVWRDKSALPEDLVFHVSYLGGDMMDFSMNFSRPGSQVLAQYFNFLRLGFEGYTETHKNSQDVALYLSKQISELGPFELITNGSDIPVFCWRMKEQKNYSLFDFSDYLRTRGWLVPAYPMPKNRNDLIVQRIVVKKGLTRDMADILVEDMKRAIDHFAAQPNNLPRTSGSHFAHL
jgi:glutamate decarboxylase